MQVHAVEQPKHRVDNHQTGNSSEQQHAPAVAVDSGERYERKHQIDCSGNHDIEEDVGDLVASCSKNLLRIVEDDVDATPLLKNREHHAQEQHLSYSRRGQLLPHGALWPIITG